MRVSADRLAQLFGAETTGPLPPGPTRVRWLEGVPVVSPATLDQACEVLRFAARERLRICPAGSGEHLPLGPAAGGPDLVLSTRRLNRIVEFEPEDMVLVAEPGATLHVLDALAAQHGQRLAPDPSPGHAATLGGAAAADRAGLARLRHRTWRDAVLGMRVVHADGRISKTGGKVVKNVAGLDLAKLYVGSYGSLVLLAEINLRLVPRPETVALVVAPVERARAQDVLLGLHRSPLRPAALLLLAGAAAPGFEVGPGHSTLLLRFEGNAAAVRWQVGEALRIAGGEARTEERASAAYAALSAAVEPRPDAALLRIASLPVAGLSVLDCLERVPAWGNASGLVVQFGVGMSHAQLVGVTARELRSLGARLAALGARLRVEHLPDGVDAPAGDVLDPVALDLVRRTKAALDPEGTFLPAPGCGGTS